MGDDTAIDVLESQEFDGPYIDPVVEAITKVMEEIGSIAKTGTNEHHKYKYAKASVVVEETRPLLAKHGLVPVQTEAKVDQWDNVLAITYDFHLLHKSGAVLTTLDNEGYEVPLVVRRTGLSRFDDKAANKCATAALKYFLIGLFQIATVDADDADSDPSPQPARAARGGRGAQVEPVIGERPPIDSPPPKPQNREPHHIERGNLSARQWGTQFVEGINAAIDRSELNGWRDLNQIEIDAIRTDAPLVYARLKERLEGCYAKFDQGFQLSNPARSIIDKFAMCGTRKALEQVWREHESKIKALSEDGHKSDYDHLVAIYQQHEQRIAAPN